MRGILAPGIVLLLSLVPAASVATGQDRGPSGDEVQAVLEANCYGCHGLGAKKGGVALDELATDEADPRDRDIWWAVLKNVRAGLMPPAGKPRPTEEERRQLEDWIKYRAFGIDPEDPDPGRVTVRRLNRIEYRNTVRDLIGVDYDTNNEFPPDDTGHGFDNIGDVLTLSPLLLEKYLAAAKAIVAQAVPTVPWVPAERTIPGRQFRRADGPDGGDGGGPLTLSYYEPATASATVPAEHEGRYRLLVDLSASERSGDGVVDDNRCRLLFRVDGQELMRREFRRQGNRSHRFEFDRDWAAGPHDLTFEVEPLTPGEKQVRSLSLRIASVTVRGPMEGGPKVRPANYARVFPGEVPEDAEGRRRYARELIGRFASRAFRRPVDAETLGRLAAFAEDVAGREGQTFEAGIAQAMTAVLASPRFLFREEAADPASEGRYPLLDEYALASRLSYFFWSTMPDEELFRLAEAGKLRANLPAQVDRMLSDPRSGEFFRHFVGQWLQARDIETVLINAAVVAQRDEPPDPDAEKRRARFRELFRKPPDQLTAEEKKELEDARARFGKSRSRFQDLELTGDLRRAMRRETEMVFEYVVRNDRSLRELLDGHYTFLNERLAKHYGIEGIRGEAMRKVDLPPESPRGGVLTQGTVLIVTSNPDRTSPVKRGLFLLDNILGTPPAPPPPDIPPLEEAGKKFEGRIPTLRETLELHRSAPLCASCHARMDPLGLALENFNALGRFREKERTDPIDPSGTLITGEPFADLKELKRILSDSDERRRNFYRCLSEKVLTYALGRGLEASDVEAVDRLVDGLEATDGRPSALLRGVVESVPFQRRRATADGITE